MGSYSLIIIRERLIPTQPLIIKGGKDVLRSLILSSLLVSFLVLSTMKPPNLLKIPIPFREKSLLPRRRINPTASYHQSIRLLVCSPSPFSSSSLNLFIGLYILYDEFTAILSLLSSSYKRFVFDCHILFFMGLGSEPFVLLG